MDPMSGSATHRTKGDRRHPFTGEDQTCSLSLVGKQAKTAKMRKQVVNARRSEQVLPSHMSICPQC